MNWKSNFPIIEWVSGYKKSFLKGDFSAGLTVGVMLIPQGMAYAMIAGLDPIYGLYASTLPLLLYAIFGTSRQLAVGPVAMVSLLTAAGIGTLAEAGTTQFIQLAIVLALLVGLIQFLLGVSRLGFLVNFLSHPVISGFTSAAALIIGLSQLKHLLGIDIPRSHHIHEIIGHAVAEIRSIHWATLAIGLGGIFLIIGLKRINKSIPGPLAAVFLGIGLVALLQLDSAGIKIVGDVPSGLPSFGVPALDLSTLPGMLPIALTIALVSFMESIAVAKAIQAKHKDYKIRPNQELIALGLANIGGSFFASYPTTGGFSRTAVNDQAGAKTGLAAIISALLIVVTLLFLTDLFYYLPKAILASVIMVAVFGLIDFKEAKHLWHSDRTDFFMLLATFIATLSLGIEQGIAVGVILSLGMVIFRSSKPHVAVLGKVPNSRFYRNVERFDHLEQRSDMLILRFDADLYFANTNFFKDYLDQKLQERKDQIRCIVFNAESINNMDSSAIHALEEFVLDCQQQQIEIAFAGVKGPVRDKMQRGTLLDLIGEEHFFMSTYDAVEAYQLKYKDNSPDDFKTYTLQTNS